MSTEIRLAPDPAVVKIRALLAAARPALAAEGRDVAKAFQQPPAAPKVFSDRSPAITTLMEHLKALREKVEAVAAPGTTATGARDLTARGLLEAEQAMGKLAESYAAPDQGAATVLLADSVRLLKAAKATGVLAGKALGIPWPFQ